MFVVAIMSLGLVLMGLNFILETRPKRLTDKEIRAEERLERRIRNLP